MAKKYQCLTYAVERFVEDNKYNPVGDEKPANAYLYWETVPKKNKHMHIKEKSMAFWRTIDGDTPGHVGYIEEIKDDGTIKFAHANVNGDRSVHYETYSDAYYMANDINITGDFLEFVGYVK